MELQMISKLIKTSSGWNCFEMAEYELCSRTAGGWDKSLLSMKVSELVQDLTAEKHKSTKKAPEVAYLSMFYHMR